MPISDVPLELEMAVTVLEDDTRRAILETLWRDAFRDDEDSGYTFEELRQAVGVEHSSRLNYHLKRMQAGGEPPVYEPVEGPDESPVHGSTRASLIYHSDGKYRVVPYLAQRLIQVWALSQPEHDPIEPTEVPWTCPHCERDLLATYRSHRLDLWCDEHGRLWNRPMLPGNAEGHSLTDLVRLSALDKSRDLTNLLQGFCQACWGPVEQRLQYVDIDTLERTPFDDILDEEADFPLHLDKNTFDEADGRLHAPLALHCDCQNCGFQWGPGIGLLACYRPVAANFFAEQGVDITTEPMIWRFVESSNVVRSVDPFRAEISLCAGEETTTFLVDGRCQIVSRDANA